MVLFLGGVRVVGKDVMQRKSNAVVFIAMTYPRGGIRHFALLGNEVYKIQDRNFDFYIASISREPDKGFWSTVRSIVPSENVIETSMFPELVMRALRLTECYNHVVIHTGGGWGQTKHFVRAIRRLGKDKAKRIFLMGTTHSYRIDSWMRIPMSVFQYVLYRLFYRKIVFQCQYAADRFVGGNDLIRRGKGVVVPLGCEPFSEPVDATPQVVAEKGLERILLNNSLFKFVYLAAFRPGKMHVWLVHAIAPVLRKHPSARVLLCGKGEQAVVRATEDAVVQEGLQGQILLTGQIPRDEIPWLLLHSNCALVPSRAETFGHNFLEPMFAGIPVLGTSVGIGRDVIVSGETGYFFNFRDSASLVGAANMMVEHPDEARRMGWNAKAAVENRFRHSDVARQLVRVYNHLVLERGKIYGR